MKYENHLTPNGRLYESGGVTPQKKQCVIASTSPAASTVAPAFIKPLGRYMKPKSNHHQPEKKIAPPKPTPRLIPTPLPRSKNIPFCPFPPKINPPSHYLTKKISHNS